MKILEFTTKAEAENCLNVIDQMAINYWQKKGYKTPFNELKGRYELVGKDPITGENAFNKQKTESWSEIKESPDNTFYFYSLTGTPFEAGMQELINQGFNFTEKDFPLEWIPKSIY